MFICACCQGAITNILEENVVQPLLVSLSAVHLAAETVRSILKIDDIVSIKRLLFTYCLHHYYLLFGIFFAAS